MPYVSAMLCVAPSDELTARRTMGTGLPADSWGYAGETQELHYLRNKVA